MSATIVTALTSLNDGGGSLPPKIINVPADYPTILEANANIGRHYYIGGSPSVTDNDPTKTNTGQTFLFGQDIVWDKATSLYVKVGDNAIFTESGTEVKMVTPQDFNMQNKKITNIEALDFNLAAAAALQEGRAKWDVTSGTLKLGLAGGNVNLPLGQAVYLPDRPKNKQGVQINKGQCVFISGYAVGVIQVQLVNASKFDDSFKTIAVANENIANNQQGFYATLGLVDGIKTNYAGWTEGDALYLDTVDGGLTKTKPSAPNSVIKMGYVLEVHATTGKIFVKIEEQSIETVKDITKEPTGFTAPEDIIVTGDGTARTVTLTGTVNAYYRGIPSTVLVTGYVSPAHTNDANPYYLVYDGSTISWVTPTAFDFSHLLIAYTFYDTDAAQRVYSRECHGLMAWETHRAEHRTIGTYRQSGGTLSDYVLASTTAADRRPSVSETIVFDEDLPSTLPALAAGGNYTNFYLSSTETEHFAPTAIEIVPVSGTQPYWNEFTGGAWQQTLMTNNYYQSIWLAAIPVASDATSQLYRFAWVQGQNESLTIAGQQGLSPQDVSLGAFNDLIPEIIFIQQVIIKYLGGNWTYEQVINLTGTRHSQTSSPQGDFLSVVTSDLTLDGSGTVGDPLSVAPTIITVGAVGTGANYNSIEDARAAGNKAVTVFGVFNETKDIALGGINLDIHVLDTLNMGAFKASSTGGNLVLHGEKITTAYTIASTKFFTSTNGDITFNCNEFNTELNFGTALGITNISGTGRTFANGCKFRLSNNAEVGFKGVKIGSNISNIEVEGGGSSCKEFVLSAGSAIFSSWQITDTFEDGGLFIEESGGNCNFSDFLYDGSPELKITLAFNNNNFSNIKGDFNIDVNDTNYNKIVNFDIKTLDLSHGSADYNTIINGRVNTTAISIGGDRNKIVNLRSDGNITVEGSSNVMSQIFCDGNFTYGASSQLNSVFMGVYSGSYVNNGNINNIFIDAISDEPTFVANSIHNVKTEKAIKTYVDAAIAAGSGVTHENITIASPGDTAFTLGAAPKNANRSILALNGQIKIYGVSADYSISGTTLTWNDPGGVTLLTTDDFQIWYDITIAPPGTLDQLQIYYSAKAGHDTNDGKSIEKPFLTNTFGASAIVAKTPGFLNQFVLKMIGGMRATESFTIPDHTTLLGDGESTVIGTVTLGSYSDIKNTRIEGSIIKATGTHSRVDSPYISNSTGKWITQSGGFLYVNCPYFEHAGSTVGVEHTGSSILHLKADRMNSTATNSTFDLNGAGTTYLDINHLRKIAGGGAALKISGGHTVYARIKHLDAAGFNAIDIAGSSTLKLFVDKLDGAIIDDTTNTIEIIENSVPQLVTSTGNLKSAVTGDTTIYDILFDTVTKSEDITYVPGTGIATMTKPGTYLFTTSISLGGLGATHTSGRIRLQTTGGNPSIIFSNFSTQRVGTDLVISGSLVREMAVSDTAKITLQVGTTVKSVNVEIGSIFTASLLKRGV